MKVRKLFFAFLTIGFLSISTGINVLWLHNAVFGLVIILLYLWYGGSLLLKIITYFFPPLFTTYTGLIISMFLVLCLVGYGSGIAVLLGTLTPLVIGAIFLTVGGALAVGNYYCIPEVSTEERFATYTAISQELFTGFSWTYAMSWISIGLFLVAEIVGFYLLHISKTGAVLTTPWQTIHPAYIYIFFLTTLILGLLIIFSKTKRSILCFLLVSHSLLVHSYLPATHQLWYGADQWRHVANEQLVVQEKELFKPVLSAEPPSFIQRLDPGAFAYKQFWGINALLARTIFVDLRMLAAWFVPIAWSIIFPLLLYQFGLVLGFSFRRALLLSWLGFLPFTFMATGSLSIPNSWGFLWFMCLVIFLAQRLVNPLKKQVVFLLCAGIISLGGYSLYAVVFILLWAMAEVVLWAGSRNRWYKILFFVLAMILSALIIPGLELLGKYSHFETMPSYVTQAKLMIANFSGWFVASGPPIGDYSIGNIVFNQVPVSAFVVNFFTTHRWLVMPFMVVFLISVVAGAIIGLRRNASAVDVWLAICWLSLMGTYIVSRYLLGGEQILSRRLENTLALFLILLAFKAWVICFSNLKMRLKVFL